MDTNEIYKKSVLNTWFLIVDFLADSFGEHCEVVLHTLENVDESIAAIRNGNISGRKVGGPITDLVLKTLKNSDESDYLANYKGRTKDGKILKSSTFFIKDLEGKVFAALCINFDVTEISAAKNVLNSLLGGIESNDSSQINGNNGTNGPIVENFSNTIEDVYNTLIQDTLNKMNIVPERMSLDEKISLVHEFDKKGVFLLKGAVAEIASALDVSEPTIYRYLKKKD